MSISAIGNTLVRRTLVVLVLPAVMVRICITELRWTCVDIAEAVECWFAKAW